MRGWVVETDDGRPGELKDVAGVSGVFPVFDPLLLKSLTWASQHYVAPLSVVLAKASPPNLPKQVKGPAAARADDQPSSHPMHGLALSAATGQRRPIHAVVGRWQDLEWLVALSPVMAAGRTAVVVTATAAEVAKIAEGARGVFGDGVVEVAGEEDATLTSAWECLQGPGRFVVGTPRLAAWKISGLAIAIVLEEGRRAMKDRQTPTIHVRDLLRTRSRIEGFTTVFFGPTPSVEVLSAGAEVVAVGNRAWPLVEVVDRSDDAPGSGLLSASVLAAVRAMVDAGERAFVLTSQKMADQMASEINARLGAPVVGREGPVIVGAERDMAGLGPMALTIASNTDGMLMGSGYRTSEEALRQLARLGNLLGSGSRRRMMVQTFDPGSDLVETLRRGDPIPYLERVLVERAQAGVPPAAEMLAVEIRGELPVGVHDELAGLSGVAVVGPLEIERGRRWLLEGDLRQARIALREMAGRWRSSSTAVRLDADPIDL